ncbi:VOC family protein [Paucilactobacillus nenjiangensis]|jgi:glyoxylase I family protein|uniref:VOC family protein n=1 Tax=Paucilactobacillus nenjiangensis TaxID=1296540 RepID=A0A5P1X177_9LACO|nr:VOC family protein [Paucilactobacillus nenjiangensis]QER66419.1 VOC family protein [Paucilactobacillus nenjiangensis]
MKLNQLDHISIIVSDLVRAKEFYVSKLGFTIKREVERVNKRDIMLDLENGQVQLEIFVKANAPTRLNYPEARGLRHLAFRVEQIEQVVDELKQKGIDCEPIRRDDFTGEKMTFLFDPDGLPLELHE